MLFDPLKIRNLELKNRVAMAPMCMYNAGDDGMVTSMHLEHYATRAVGGVALILTEAAAVSPDGRISRRDLGIWNDAQIEGLHQLVERVHSYDCKIGVQVAHAGRKSEAAVLPLAPSALRFSETYHLPQALTIEEIQDVKKEFLNAVKRAVKAGFDVVELHGAHGYFIHQMLSPFTNKREDIYGGSFENRVRFLCELVTETRKFYDGVLFVRLSAVEYQEEAFTLEDSIELATLLKALDVDLIDVSSGGNAPIMPPKIFPGYQIEYAKAIKEKAGIKTAAVGIINTYELAEQTLKNEEADLILLGRELLRNPYWAANTAKLYEDKDVMLKNYVRAYQ